MKHSPAYEDGTDRVPKRRQLELRRRGITQKGINYRIFVAFQQIKSGVTMGMKIARQMGCIPRAKNVNNTNKIVLKLKKKSTLDGSRSEASKLCLKGGNPLCIVNYLLY